MLMAMFMFYLNIKNLGQYDRLSVLACKPVDGVLVVLSSDQLNIATFVHQMGDMCLPSGEQVGIFN